MCSILGGLCRHRSAPRDEDPDGDEYAACDLRAPSGSDSSTTASTAATNGCRFAASVARAGPILCEDVEPQDVRQDERAHCRENRAAARPASRPPSPARSSPADRPARSSTQATVMTTALTRDGEYVSMSGATATEYAAQVAAVTSPSSDPARSRLTRRPGAQRQPARPRATRSPRLPRSAVRGVLAERDAEQRREDRDRADQQADRRRARGVEREDEADLVEPQQHGREQKHGVRVDARCAGSARATRRHATKIAPASA